MSLRAATVRPLDAFVGLLMLAAPAASADEVVTTSTVLAAHRHGPTIRFEPPHAIDWKEQAPPNVRCLADGTCVAQLKDLWIAAEPTRGGSRVVVEFDAALPNDFVAGHYNYLSAAGRAELTPHQLAGRLVLALDPEQPQVRWHGFEGWLVADSSALDSTGGFVVRTDTPVPYEQFTARRPGKEYLHARPSEPGARSPPPVPDSYTIAAIHELTLGLGGARLAYVEWWPLHASTNAEHNVHHGLYLADDPMTRIANVGHRTPLVHEGQPVVPLKWPGPHPR